MNGVGTVRLTGLPPGFWTEAAQRYGLVIAAPSLGVRCVEATVTIAFVALALSVGRQPRRPISACWRAGVESVARSWPAAGRRTGTVLRLAAALSAGAAAGFALGGGAGLVAGLIMSAAALAIAVRGATRAEQGRRRRLAAAAAAPADLFAAGLSAGLLPAGAAGVVATAYGRHERSGRYDTAAAVIAERFGQVAEALIRGVDPEPAWRPLLVDAATASIGGAALRSSRTGAPMALTAVIAARECREVARQAARAQIRAVAVRATAPLALCFLPAFVLVGIVPTALGLLAGLRP